MRLKRSLGAARPIPGAERLKELHALVFQPELCWLKKARRDWPEHQALIGSRYVHVKARHGARIWRQEWKGARVSAAHDDWLCAPATIADGWLLVWADSTLIVPGLAMRTGMLLSELRARMR